MSESECLVFAIWTHYFCNLEIYAIIFGFWTFPSSCFYLNNVLETEFCLCFQVEHTQLGLIDRASPEVTTP
jgi:hypothetical protein